MRRILFTGIGRYANELVTVLLYLNPGIALRVNREGNYTRPEAGERYRNWMPELFAELGNRLSGGPGVRLVTVQEVARVAETLLKRKQGNGTPTGNSVE